MGREQLKGYITRVSIGGDEPFGNVDQSVNPTKLADNKFYIKENYISKAGSYGSLEKRGGMTLHNANKLTAGKPVTNIFEAKMADKYYLLGKDNGASGTAVMRYCERPYSTAWTNVATSEYDGFYRFMQYKENIYVTNRQNAGAMLPNKVWQGGSNFFEHGAIPPSQYFGLLADLLTLTPATLTGAGMTDNKVYYYIVTYLYDGYQESSAFEGQKIIMGSGQNAVLLSKIPLGDTRVKARYIYRSTAQDDELSFPRHFYRVGMLTDNTSTTFTDVRGDALLAPAINADAFFDQKRPPRSKSLAVAQDRLIAMNTETDPEAYTAIETGKVHLTEATSPYTAGMSAGTYKYRIYKAYASHGGGRLIYLLGNYVEQSISISAGHGVNIAIDSSAEIMSNNWTGRVVIMRTKAGGDKFFPLTTNLLSPSTWTEMGISHNKMVFVSPQIFRDEEDDVSLEAIANLYAVDFIYGGEVVNTPRAKGAVYISEAGNGDLFPALNVKLVDVRDNVGITGGFVEDGGMVMFTGTGIYRMDTRPISSDFWTIDKVVENIGALGQDAYVKNSRASESIGHNGILQLPDGGGYIFFNRASSTVASQAINIYYWSGRGNPEIMSDPIFNYINGSTAFSVGGMCYDFVRDWVWIVAKTASRMILIYDLRLKEWYVFTLDSTLVFSEIICTEDGQILMGATDGQVNAYAPTTYQDEFGATAKTITAKVRIKSFDEHDADITVRRVSTAFDSSSSGATMSQDIVSTDQSGSSTTSAQTYTSVAGTIHRSKKNVNINCRRFYVELTNTETKNIILNKITVDYKVNFSEDGGQ